MKHNKHLRRSNNTVRISLFTVVMLFLFVLVGSSQPVTYSGLVDAYYSVNFASPSSYKNELRNFDVNTNSFTLSQVELVIQRTTSASSPIGFRMDLDYGATNDLVQTSLNTTLANVQQAYITAVLPVGGGLTVDAGKFVTHMGNEVIESKDNWNYSRSYLFAFAIPYYHTGMRLTYPVFSNLTATLHVLDGWNSVTDVVKSTNIGATVNYAATSSTGIIFNGIWGHTGYEPGARNVYDFIVSQTVFDNLLLAVNADYGEAGAALGLATWKGVDIYGRYAIDTLSAVALRGEVYDDPLGYTTGIKNTYKEVTLTLEHKLFNQMLLRGELREDIALNPAYDKTALATETSQITFTIGAVVTF
ncbi:MAG TPA: porin [Bacteroidota bacterium]|nr:porin [Bacteroidota bacterium]